MADKPDLKTKLEERADPLAGIVGDTSDTINAIDAYFIKKDDGDAGDSNGKANDDSGTGDKSAAGAGDNSAAGTGEGQAAGTGQAAGDAAGTGQAAGDAAGTGQAAAPAAGDAAGTGQAAAPAAGTGQAAAPAAGTGDKGAAGNAGSNAGVGPDGVGAAATGDGKSGGNVPVSTPPKKDDGSAPPADGGNAPGQAAAGEIFPEIKLPANSRGESAKAFATVKLKAAEEINRRDAEIKELRAKAEQFEAAAKTTVPSSEVQKLQAELEEHRQWRAKLDLKADPAFNSKFDGRIASASDFIMNRVRATGKLSEAALKKITDMGGPAAIEWTDIFSKINDPTVQRVVQNKLDEIEAAQYERDTELEKTGKEIDKYVESRREEFKQQNGAHTETTRLVLDKILNESDALKKRAPTSGATAEQKVAIDGHNKFVDEVIGTVNQALSDDSAHMRAVLISGLATHMLMRKTVEADKVALTAKVTVAEKERDTFKAQAADLQAKLDAIKKSGSARRETSASSKPTKITTDLASAGDAFKAWEQTRA